MDGTLPAVYRSEDPIDNLLLRVSLRRRAAPGEPPVDVVAYTCAPAAELFLNGASLGVQQSAGSGAANTAKKRQIEMMPYRAMPPVWVRMFLIMAEGRLSPERWGLRP
jgi:hypothetical protein